MTRSVPDHYGLTRKRSNGKTERYHSKGSRYAIRPGSLWLAATVVAPGHTKIVPLMPEFIESRRELLDQLCDAALRGKVLR